MKNELIEYLESIIQKNRVYIPKGYKLWEKQKAWASQSVEKVVQLLISLFEEEEKSIEKGRQADYVTILVRSFAIELVRGLMKYNDLLFKTAEYTDLLGQKYMAYAFYHLLDMNDINSDSQNLLQDTKYMKCLYHGLMKFYTDFYGSFKDNEEAICLLCKYYPKKDDSWIEKEEFIDALLDHIKNAGTSSDLGYAYHGIEQIQKYIHGLSDKMILELLKQYNLFGLLNQKKHRHQIFAIINGSDLENTKKRALKFFYLDSLMLANIFNNVWVEKEKELGNKVEVHFYLYDDSLDKEQIQVCENPDAYWDNKNIEKRLFYIEKRQMADISVTGESITFTVRGSQADFPFEYSDWELEEFQTKKASERIRRLVSGDISGKPEEKQMVFSLLYLDDYRGIRNRILDFDHRFMFYPDSRELKPQETERKSGLHFYGKAIYSLSCIVGKNGMGKTSVVDFLRETFYKILKSLEESDISCEQGCIDTEGFHTYFKEWILDDKIKFLVVFRIGEKDYFLTNITNIIPKAVLPYQKGIGRNLDFCKVVYFSQQLRADQVMLLEHAEKTERQEVSGISRILEGFGQCDYSEMKSFVIRKNALSVLEERRKKTSGEEEPMVNRELCYRLSLLRNIDMNKFCNFLDIPTNKEFVIYNLKSGEILQEFVLDDCKDISKMKEIEKKYVKMPDVEIGYVSSGQYAKFMFLAKLYWFLEGYHKDSEYYRDIFGRQIFSREDALNQEESALIFIDEGELYYHPEWQRRYLSTLLDMMCLCKEKSKLQIVFTTNSPFMVSDMLKEDVQYLSANTEEFDNTLGQNIHKLLKKNFFMDYTIGEYSRKLIEAIIWRIGDVKEDFVEEKMDLYHYFDAAQDEYEMIGFLIDQIGEPVYRNKLKKMLEELMGRKKTSRESRIRELERQKADLEQKISQLKEEEYGKN